MPLLKVILGAVASALLQVATNWLNDKLQQKKKKKEKAE